MPADASTVKRRHNYRRLLTYASPYTRTWTAIVGATLLSTGLSLLQPWPLKILVDHVLGEAALSGVTGSVVQALPGTDSPAGLLGWVVAAGLGIFALNAAIDVLLSMEWTRLGRRMVYRLSQDLFARVQRQSLRTYGSHSVGDSMGRIAVDAWCVHTLVDTLFFAPGHALLTTVMMVLVMLRLDAGLTLLALAIAPFMAGTAWLFGRPIRQAAHARRDVETRIQAHVHQTLTGVSVVQAFAREDDEQRRFQELASEAIRAHQRNALIGSAYGLGSGLITTLGTAVVMWTAAQRVLDGRLTVGTTLVFLSYLASLQWQLSVFGSMYTALQSAGASVDRVMDVFERHDAVPERADAHELPGVRGEVILDNVVFGYVPDRPVLRGVSLVAHPGETIAIVGSTGAGKSTLVNLIPRFYDPTGGRVLIDGHDVRDVTVGSLRDQIAVVLQEPFLFPISIADNIALGRPDASRADVEAAARAANAHAFIAALPGGYDTVLGERGVTLSGGERQRIAIARAILKDAPILILDEPTSALDAETEHAIVQALDRLMRGRTTFMIAHRFSTIRNADRIVVLEDGAVVEEGGHDGLVVKEGRYAELHHLQYGQPELAGSV